jgi:RES domain-containing protein
MVAVRTYALYGVGTEGAKKIGGRYNVAGSFGALYLSDRPDTVVHEVHQRLNVGKFSNAVLAPFLLLSFSFQLSKVLDLRNPKVVAALKLGSNDLDQNWKDLNRKGKLANTQRLAMYCYGLGFEGIVVPSVRLPSTYNLVIFDQLGSNSFWQPQGEELLKPLRNVYPSKLS